MRRSIMDAALEELSERGYSEFSLQRALQSVGASDAEFEAEFASEDQCLFAAYQMLADDLCERALGACVDGEPWIERVRGCLAALLDELAGRPEMARVLIRTFPGIRPEAYELYGALIRRFEPAMREGREYSDVKGELPRELELLAVGSAEAIIFDEIDAGRAEQLPAMLPEILFSLLVPYLGPERAAEAMQDAAAL